MICTVRIVYPDAKPVDIKVSVTHKHMAVDAAKRFAVDQGMIKSSMVDSCEFILRK